MDSKPWFKRRQLLWGMFANWRYKNPDLSNSADKLMYETDAIVIIKDVEKNLGKEWIINHLNK